MPPTSGQRHNDGGDTLENAPHYHHERATSNNATNGDHHRSTTQPGATILQGDATVPRPVATAGAGSHQPTPLFERLVTEEVQELKAYVRIVENQNRRLEELERVHGDLERRLEVETRGRKHLEVTLEAREREWKEKFEHLESERDHWKKVVEAEKTKNSRLIDQVVRKDQDIHRMLQRKYDHEIGRSVRNVRHGDKPITNSTSSSKSPELRHETSKAVQKSAVHKSPHEALNSTGSEERVRVRNAESFLLDFFNL